MTDKDKIEKLLNNYRLLKSDIRTAIIEKCPDYSLPAIDYSKVSGGETNAIYSKVEDFVVEKVDNDLSLVRKIKARDIIHTAYMSLTLKKRRIIKYLYFEDMSQLQTGLKIGKSERTIRARKNEVIQDLKESKILRAWKYLEIK